MCYGSTKELVRVNCGVLRVLNVVYQCATCVKWVTAQHGKLFVCIKKT